MDITGIKYISSAELKADLQSGKDIKIIDVSEPAEYAASRIEPSDNIPLGILQLKLTTNELSFPAGKKIVVYCAHGNRSRFAAAMLEAKGYKEVYSLAGGIEDFQRNES